MNRSGQDGAKGERAVATALQQHWPLADRRVKRGADDRGDIGGIAPGVIIEVKHAPKRLEISSWLRECDREISNDSAELGVVWFKIRGMTDPLDWPVMMRGRYFVPLLQLWTAEHGYGETEQLKLF